MSINVWAEFTCEGRECSAKVRTKSMYLPYGADAPRPKLPVGWVVVITGGGRGVIGCPECVPWNMGQ